MRATEGRQIRIDSEDRLGRVGTESRELPEVLTHAWSNKEDNLDAIVYNTKDLLERICSRENMRLACERVIRNRDAGGVDVWACRSFPRG